MPYSGRKSKLAEMVYPIICIIPIIPIVPNIIIPIIPITTLRGIGVAGPGHGVGNKWALRDNSSPKGHNCPLYTSDAAEDYEVPSLSVAG